MGINYCNKRKKTCLFTYTQTNFEEPRLHRNFKTGRFQDTIELDRSTEMCIINHDWLGRLGEFKFKTDKSRLTWKTWWILSLKQGNLKCEVGNIAHLSNQPEGGKFQNVMYVNKLCKQMLYVNIV